MQPTLPIRDEWTFEDLQELNFEDWRRLQIIDGALLVSPPPALRHEFVNASLRDLVVAAVPDGHVVFTTAGVRMSRSFFIPDLVVMPLARYREADVLEPEDVLVAIEVESPSSRTTDRVLKATKYAEAGIAHYWRVESRPVRLSAYDLPPAGDVYVEVGSWGVGETAVVTEPFPLSIEIARLQPPGDV